MSYYQKLHDYDAILPKEDSNHASKSRERTLEQNNNPFLCGPIESTVKKCDAFEIIDFSKIPERKEGRKIVPGSPNIVLLRKKIVPKSNSLLLSLCNIVEKPIVIMSHQDLANDEFILAASGDKLS